MVSAATTDARTNAAAAMSTASGKPSLTAPEPPNVTPLIPAKAGNTATAINPPVRATSLLTAEATPECSAGAAASTVAVSGATITATPRPKTTIAGSTRVK